jgi:hypothetical protein
MEPKNEQIQNNQASNNAAKSQQPKKTWVEPELIRMVDVVESGGLFNYYENGNYYLYTSSTTIS